LTEGFPSLKELVERELARRANAEDMRAALTFIAHDTPNSLVSVDEAVKAIEATDGDDSGKPIYVAKAIEVAVLDALQTLHPKRAIVCSSVVKHSRSLRDLARPDLELDATRDVDAAERAVERNTKRPTPTHWAN
jgi:hypothetical protein